MASRRARTRRDKRAPWQDQDDYNQAFGRFSFCNQARIPRAALEPAWILGLCVCIQRRKSAVFAQLVKKFPCGLGSHFSAALALSYCRSQAAS